MNFDNIKWQCIKGLPIPSVKTRTLSELGFPVDVVIRDNIDDIDLYKNLEFKLYRTPYSVIYSVEKEYLKLLLRYKDKNKALEETLYILREYEITMEELKSSLIYNNIYNLVYEEVDTLIEEFMFIINKLIPRQLSDIYYSFDIKPNPTYSIFFDLASERLNLTKNMNKNDKNYGKFVSHMEESIKNLIKERCSLLSIYLNTCASKADIKDVLSKINHDEIYEIEERIFSLSKQYTYSIDLIDSEGIIHFCIFKDEIKVLNIAYISCYKCDEIQDIDEYVSELSMRFNDVPCLVIDYYELSDSNVTTIIRNTLKDYNYIKKHTKKRNTYRSMIIKCNKIYNDTFHNYDYAKSAKVCGCLFCEEVFDANELKEYIEDEDTGIKTYECPYCGRDYVIMDSQGYDIDEMFMEEISEIMDRWLYAH